MQAVQGQDNSKLAEILSTHPIHQTRIQNIRQYLPEALAQYKKQ